QHRPQLLRGESTALGGQRLVDALVVHGKESELRSGLESEMRRGSDERKKTDV
ncbi:unnamed protein product, partial [Musa hybrid cultivar]